MKITYSLSKISADTVRTCDEARRAFQRMLVTVARTQGMLPQAIVWVVSRFYTRKVTGREIEYDFYLIKNNNKK